MSRRCKDRAIRNLQIFIAKIFIFCRRQDRARPPGAMIAVTFFANTLSLQVGPVETWRRYSSTQNYSRYMKEASPVAIGPVLCVDYKVKVSV